MLPDSRDQCLSCPKDRTEFNYTIVGNVGTCSELISAEIALMSSLNLEDDDGRIGKGTIVGIVVSVVIAGIGGIFMLLKNRKDKENQGVVLARLQQMEHGIKDAVQTSTIDELEGDTASASGDNTSYVGRDIEASASKLGSGDVPVGENDDDLC